MKRTQKPHVIIILQLVLLFGYSCAPNLQKMVPEDRAFDFEPTDKSINIANVTGGVKSSKGENLEGKSSIGTTELKRVLVESIKKSNIFSKVSSDVTTNTCDYELSAWIISQWASVEGASIRVQYRIDGREWHLEKTIDSSYDRHENYWSLSTSTKTLERAVRKNMEKLLIELFYLGKVEEAHSAYLIAHKDQSIAAYQQFLSRYGKSIFAREAQLNIGSVYTPF